MKKFIYSAGLLLCAWSASAQNNINGTFETWRTYTSGGQTLEAPQGWYGGDSLTDAFAAALGATPQKQVTKVTSAHGGTYAVQLVSANYGGGTLDTIPGTITSAKPKLDLISQTLSFSNYPTVNQRIPSMSFWVKTAPVGQDSGYAEVQMLKSGLVSVYGGDSIIGYSYVDFGTISNYAKVTMPITYVNSTIVPDRILITFSSGYSTDANNPGSTMTVDDAALLTTTGIAQPLFGGPVVRCYPNPSNGIVRLSTASAAPLTWQAYTVDGRLAASVTFSGEGEGNLKAQPDGIYLYRITDAAGTLVQSGSLRLAH